MAAHNHTDNLGVELTRTNSACPDQRDPAGGAISVETEQSTPRVVDNLPDSIPILARELSAIEMYLGDLIDSFVNS